MTPALYAKLSAQVERQSAELADYESEIADRNIKSLNLQPAIDAAQAALDEAQATLQALQARPEDAPEDWQAPDTTAEQEAVNTAQKALDDAKAPQTAINSERDTLSSYATAIKASMAQCQKEMDASGLKLTAEEVAAIRDAPTVPKEVTMRQARLALLGAGVLAGVDAAIDAMPEPTRSAARIEWEYSGAVQRHNGFVAALGPALGMTGAQIDALFVAAAKL